MKLRKMSKKAKSFLIINTVLIIYIFMLSLGYSLYSQTLKISGSAGIDNPNLKICPFEMKEILSITGIDTNNQFRRYFAEYQDLNDSNVGIQSGAAHILDSYDKERNTYNFFSNNAILFPNDPHNGGNSLFGPYKTLSKPMYMIFENTTSYPLDVFHVKPDNVNSVMPTIPINYLDIRWYTTNNIQDINNIIQDDLDNLNFWNQLQPNSIFKDGNFDSVDNDGAGPYYSYSEFVENYNNNALVFPTYTVNNGEYLILGIKFSDIEIATWESWLGTGTSLDFYYPNRANDGLSFKFWDEKFNEESAFTVRMAFVDTRIAANYFIDLISYDLNEFYSNPRIYPYPVSWWRQT